MTTPTLTFRDATADDAEAVSALVESAYRGESSRAGWTTEADLLGGQRLDPDMALEMIQADDSRVLLACSAGELVGVVNIKREDEYAYFGSFAVSPAAQGAGLGRAILAAAQQRAVSEWGARGFRLTVIRQRADLIAFYERRGFALTGNTEPFPYGQPKFGEPKVDDLEFVEMVKVF